MEEKEVAAAGSLGSAWAQEGSGGSWRGEGRAEKSGGDESGEVGRRSPQGGGDERCAPIACAEDFGNFLSLQGGKNVRHFRSRGVFECGLVSSRDKINRLKMILISIPNSVLSSESTFRAIPPPP